MSKRDAAPTHSWVFMSHVYKLLGRAFMFIIVCLIVAAWTLSARLRSDCTDRPSYNVEAFGYMMSLELSRPAGECVQAGVGE